MKPRLTPFRKAISRNKLYGILLVIVFGITTSLGVAALTDSQKERVADMVRIIRESAATLSGADLAEYYGAINVGLQDAIQVLTDVRDNVAQNAPVSPCGTMPTVVGGIQNMPVCDTVTKQWKNQDGSPVVTAGSTTSTIASSSTNATVTNMNSRNCLKSYGTDIAFVKENSNQPFWGGPYGKGGDFRWQPENWAFVLPSSAFDSMNELEITLGSGVPNPNAPANDASGLPLLGMHLYECINGERVLISKDYAAEVPYIRAILWDYKSYVRNVTYPNDTAKQEKEIKRLEQYYFLGYKPNTLYIVEFKNTGNQYRAHRGPYNARNVEQFLAETDLGKTPLASNSQSVPYEVTTKWAYWIGPSSAISSNTTTTTSTTTSSSPCGPMPTGIGGIQDMPTCGSDGKWRDPSGKVIGGEASSTSSIKTAQNTNGTTNSTSPCGPMPTGIGGIQNLPTCNTTTGQWETPVSATDSTACGKIPDDFVISSPSGIPSCNTITKKWEHYYDRIFIENTYQVYDMTKKNTLTNVVNGAGLNTETTKVCLEVLAHPNVPNAVNTGYCSDTKNFTSFAGNTDWTFVKGKGWIQNAPYDAAVWGAAGIKVKAFWMNTTNGTISSSLIEVVSGTSQASSNNTSSSPCGPMPTGIGGIQDMPTCGSDGKWRDPSGKVIGGDTNTTWGVKTAQSANNTSTTSSICGGSKPTGPGVESQEVGITAGETSWHYSSSLGACSWRCSSGYTRSGNSCIQNATSGTNQNTSTTTSNTSQGTPANEKIRITGKSCNFTGAPQTYYYKMGGTCGGALFDCNNGALEYSSTQFISIVNKPTPTTPVYDTEDLCNGITGSNVKIDVAYGRTELNCLSPDGGLAIEIWNAKEDIEICQEVDIGWRNQKNVCNPTGTEGWVKASTAWPGAFDGKKWSRYANLLDHKAYVPGKYRFAVRSSDEKVVYSNWITVVAQAGVGAEQFVNPQSCIPNRYKPASTEELIDYKLNHASFWMGFIDFSGLGSNASLVSKELFSLFELGGSAVPKMGSTIAYSYPGMHKYFTKSVPTPPSTYKDAYGTVIAGESGNTAYFDFQSWYKGGSAWTAAICSSAHPTVPLPVSQVHGGKAWKSGEKEPTKCN